MRKLLALLLLAAPLFAQNPVTPTYPTAVTDAEMGVFQDRAYSSLTVAVTSTATTLTVADGSRFPDDPFWVIVGPSTSCSPGRPTTGCETIYITGVTGNVLTIGATGRQITAGCTGTATGGSNPTHAVGEYVVQSIPACWANRVSVELAAIVNGGGGGGADALGTGDPGANGIMVRTAEDVTTARTITGDSEITVTNGNGVSGNPTLAIGAAIARDAEVAAAYQPLDAELTAVAGISSNGLIARTGAGTAAPRTITGSSQVGVTNGDGQAGNPALSINTNSIGPTQVDETANYVFSGTLFPTSATPTTSAVGQIAFDTNAWAASRGAVQIYDGTANTFLVGTLASDTPTNGQVPKWNTGGTVTWEDDASAGGADFLGDWSSPTERTLASGTATFTSTSQTIDTESDAASDDWTGATCAAGVVFPVRAANDARTINIIAASIPTPTDTDLSLDQDGDWALVACYTANSPEVLVFKDEDGQILYNVTSSLVPTLTTVQDSTKAKISLLRHADDCTSLTDGIDGQACFEKDANTLYVCESPEGENGNCDAAGEWTVLSAAATENNDLETDGAAGIADDELPLGSGAGTVVYTVVPDCDNATTSKLLYDQATNTFSCGTDQSGGSGGWTLIGESGAASAVCDGGASYVDFATVTIPSGTLAVGDIFDVKGWYPDNDCTTCATDVRLTTGGLGQTLSNMADNIEAYWHTECAVVTNTTAVCNTLQVQGPTGTTDNDQALTITFNDFTSSNNDIVFAEKECASGDSASIAQLVVTAWTF